MYPIKDKKDHYGCDWCHHEFHMLCDIEWGLFLTNNNEKDRYFCSIDCLHNFTTWYKSGVETRQLEE